MTSRSSTSTDRIWTDLSESVALDRYRELARVIDAGIFELDSAGYFVAVSDALLEITGHARDDLLEEHLSVLIGDQDATRLTRDTHDVIGRREETGGIEATVQTADGRSVRCEVRAGSRREDGGRAGTIGMMRVLDQPAPTETQTVPELPEDLLSTVLKKVDEGIIVLNDEFEITWAGASIGEFFGFDPNQLIGRKKHDVVNQDFKQAVANPEEFADRVFSAYESNDAVSQFTCEILPGPNRQHRWLQHWSKPIESGQYAGGRVELYTEITDQKHTAAALQETEERFYSLVEAVEEYAIFRLDPEGNVVSWNEGAKKIKGYEPDEILGQHISTFYTESDRAAGVPEANLAAATEHGSLQDEGWRVKKDGSRFWANVNITTVRDADGTHRGFLKVTRDMTDRYEREQELESELNRILSRISDAFYALDEDWRFTLVNEQAEKLLQKPREELLTQSLWEMFPEAKETIVWDRFHEAMETQEPVSFDIEYDALDIWAEASAYPSESGLSVYFRDITERREKQQQIREREQELAEYKEYTDKILNAIDDLLYVIGKDGTFQRWNESLSAVTGYSDEEIGSMEPAEFFADGDAERIAAAVDNVFETGSTRIEADIVTESGDRIPMEFVASAVETPGGEQVIAGIGRDITERIEREQALEESNERLEQFAHAASHDLQEPLRMVSSYLQLIEQRYDDQLDEDGREFLQFAVDGADRMRDMIDGLLAYSRIESKGGPLEPVDLDEILDDACDNLRVAVAESNAEITSEQLPSVRGDDRQLRQLFQNLLDNAIKYSGDEPPAIHVSARAATATDTKEASSTVPSAPDDQWVISVEDDGIGVAPEDQERIFEVFQSIKAADDNSSGIGLALCKRIVERHGGDIWIDSQPGEGSTISFTLPATGDSDE